MQQLGDDGSGHSPIHGFAYDGYPIMGPYQAKDTIAVSCWQARDFSASSPTGCSDGTRSCLLKDSLDYTQGTTTTTKVGPSLTGTVTSQSSNTIYVTSGAYYEDYFYNATCHAAGGQYLDSHNGHDHDDIGYHYHLTMDSAGIPTFPYAPGPKYYGCLPSKSQGCGTSYMYGAGLGSTTGSYGGGTSTCGTTSAVSSTCSSDTWTLATTSVPSKAPTPTVAPTKSPATTTAVPTKAPVTVPATNSPTVVSTKSPTKTPTVTNSYKDKLKDYSCYHSYSWMKNIDGSKSSLFAGAYEDITSSGYTGARRRLQTKPPPPSGGAASPAPTVAALKTGWKVSFSGIPSYYHNLTAWDMNLLNTRPKKSTDFNGGKTTVSQGQIVQFGANIGYKSTGCTMGYWPPGPGCPADIKGSYIFPVAPAPETSTSKFDIVCLRLLCLTFSKHCRWLLCGHCFRIFH